MENISNDVDRSEDVVQEGEVVLTGAALLDAAREELAERARGFYAQTAEEVGDEAELVQNKPVNEPA